jgi:hypothetical protein
MSPIRQSPPSPAVFAPRRRRWRREPSAGSPGSLPARIHENGSVTEDLPPETPWKVKTSPQ